jgi:hypothetical protein
MKVGKSEPMKPTFWDKYPILTPCNAVVLCDGFVRGAYYQAFGAGFSFERDWQKPCLKAPTELIHRSMRKLATIGTIVCVGVLSTNADLADQKRRLEQELPNIPVPELPARAAEIVRATPAAERSQAAIITVEAIIARYPASAASVVSAVAQAAPETGPAAAAAATKLTPSEAASIAAAGRPVPAKAGQANPVNGNGNGNGNAGGNNNGGGPGNGGNGGNGNGHANGGVGLGPGPNKPGAPVHHDRPINTVLPNGKPRPFPPSPPNRPVNPPRPHKYNKPHPHH